MPVSTGQIIPRSSHPERYEKAVLGSFQFGTHHDTKRIMLALGEIMSHEPVDMVAARTPTWELKPLSRVHILFSLNSWFPSLIKWFKKTKRKCPATPEKGLGIMYRCPASLYDDTGLRIQRISCPVYQVRWNSLTFRLSGHAMYEYVEGGRGARSQKWTLVG